MIYLNKEKFQGDEIKEENVQNWEEKIVFIGVL
jgi:hypothetical protein